MTKTMTQKAAADHVALLAFDRTQIGQRVFNLLSACRTELSDQARMADEDIEGFLEMVDEILSPVGDGREQEDWRQLDHRAY